MSTGVRFVRYLSLIVFIVSIFVFIVNPNIMGLIYLFGGLKLLQNHKYLEMMICNKNNQYNQNNLG
jgi:hypothetical protein